MANRNVNVCVECIGLYRVLYRVERELGYPLLMPIYYNACHIYFYDRALIYSVQTARYSPYLYSGYCCDVEIKRCRASFRQRFG